MRTLLYEPKAYWFYVCIAQLVLWGAPALGQSTQPLPEYTLTLKSGEITYIAQWLRERPYKDVADLLNKMQGQISAQEEQAKKAAEKPAETEEAKP